MLAYYDESFDYNYCGKIRYGFLRRYLSTKTRIWCNMCLHEAVSSSVRYYIAPCPNCSDRLAFLTLTGYWYGKYLVLSIWRATCDVLSTARNEKPQAGCLRPLLLGKGSTFCHACTCNDNDHAGDIVRTCRDYVISRSRNVTAMVIPHQTSRGSASRHLQALSSQFTPLLASSHPSYMSPYRWCLL